MDFLNNSPWFAIWLIGYVVSFAVSLIFLLTNIFAGFTIKANNLRQIGFRISWVDGRPKPMKEEDLHREPWYFFLKFCLAVLGLGLSAIFSWLNVILIPIQFLIVVIKSFGAPRDVKDAIWRMKNLHLDFDGVVRQSAAISGALDYAADRAELLKSLKERKLIADEEYERLMRNKGTAGNT